MPPESNDLARLLEAVEALRLEVARLSERVSAIESAAPAPTSAPASEADAAIGPELVYVISAAVAAFLGKRAHVRQIRLLGSDAWAQQGRITVQASHRLDVLQGS